MTYPYAFRRQRPEDLEAAGHRCARCRVVEVRWCSLADRRECSNLERAHLDGDRTNGVLGQQTGGIESRDAIAPTPGQPGYVSITTPALACRATETAWHAGEVQIACTAGDTTIGPYTYPLLPGRYLSLVYGQLDGEAISFTARADASGNVTVQGGTSNPSVPGSAVVGVWVKF